MFISNVSFCFCLSVSAGLCLSVYLTPQQTKYFDFKKIKTPSFFLSWCEPKQF